MSKDDNKNLMEPASPEDGAAEAFARLRSDEANATSYASVDQWRMQNSENRRAWFEVECTWRKIEVVQDEPAVLAMRKSAVARGDAYRKARRAYFAAAAAVLLAVGLAAALFYSEPWLVFQPGSMASHDRGQSWSSAVGERKIVQLADGSRMILSTDSVVSVKDWGDVRSLTLQKGQAYFEVAKDAARPFIVTAAGTRVTALGTAFDVRLDARRFEVTLVEGRVRVDAVEGGANADRVTASRVLTPGTQLVRDEGADWRVTSVDTSRETSWLRDQLVFDGQQLPEVVAEMNRFSRRKLLITDPRLNAVQVSGVFRTGEVANFARALESYQLARVASQSTEEIELISP